MAKAAALSATRGGAAGFGGSAPGPSNFADYDQGVVWVSVLLLLFGLVMVYSASIAFAEGSSFTGHRPQFFLLRHTLSIGLGFLAAYAVFQVPMAALQRGALPLFLLGVVALVLVLIPGIGKSVNGARRWIPLVIMNAQPSEVMKLLAVLYAADYTVRKAAVMHSLKQGFMPMAIAMVFIGWLLLREPDMGAFVVVVTIAIGVLFLGGMNVRLFFGAHRRAVGELRAG